MGKAVKGEVMFDSSTRKVKKFDNTPLPVAIYEGKLQPGAAVQKAAGAGKLPYVVAFIEVLNTAGKAGGKNRRVRHSFFLNCTPSEKGHVAVDSQDGILAYCKATGQRLKCPFKPATKVGDDGKPHNVTILDPARLVKYLEGTAGQVFKFKTKNKPNTKPGADPKDLFTNVDFFVEAGESSESSEDEDSEDEDDAEDDVEEDDDSSDDEDEEDSSDEEDDEENDEDAEDDDEDGEELDEDEDEDDEGPSTKPSKKVKQGPKGKGKK